MTGAAQAVPVSMTVQRRPGVHDPVQQAVLVSMTVQRRAIRSISGNNKPKKFKMCYFSGRGRVSPGQNESRV